MNQSRMQFAIGVVTLISFFALAAIILWFGEFDLVLQKRVVYYVLFKNAPGVEARVPVRRAGIRIGEVRSVEYSDVDSLVVVTVVLERGNVLREGDEPTLRRELLGDTFLEIETRAELRGKGNRPIIVAESTLEGRSPLDASQTLASAAEMMPNAQSTLVEVERATRQWTIVGEKFNRMFDVNQKRVGELIDQTRDVMENLETTLNSINMVLDDNTRENIRVAVKNVRETSDDLEPLAKSARTAIDRINESVARLDDIAANLQTIIKPLTKKSDAIVNNADESLKMLQSSLADVKAITGQMRSQDSTFQRLITNPSIYHRADESMASILRSLQRLEEVMADVKVFSDKIARHPGELGVQGVLSKDAGLKTPPRARPLQIAE